MLRLEDVQDDDDTPVERTHRFARSTEAVSASRPAGRRLLGAARRAYPELTCATANEGTEYVTTDYCTGRVAPGRFIWFGRDPVRSIAVSRAAFG